MGSFPDDFCRPFPDDATYKTIGLPPCPRCKSTDCWALYLSWEKASRITYNQDEHPETTQLWLEAIGHA